MSSGDVRKTVRLKRPNILFETWLTEWQQHAESINSEARFKFEKALSSLRKYPLVLSTGKECMILEHFDAALCIKLDRRLAEYRKSGNSNTDPVLPLQSNENIDPVLPLQSNENIDIRQTECVASGATKIERKRKKSNSAQSDQKSDSQKSSETSSPQPKKKPYLPKNRSGPFALLVTLFKNEESNGAKDWMSKAELQLGAQPLCDMSLTRPQQGTFYTAWSSMSQLITRGYVKKQSHPPRFSLTADGRELAKQLISLYPDEVSTFVVQCDDPSRLLTATTASDILAPGRRGVPKSSPKKARRKDVDGSSQASTMSSQMSSQSDEVESGPEYFTPNSFDIVLLVDTAETIGVQRQVEDEALRELTKLGVNFEVRHLNVGDFLWVARDRESGKELTLPYVVERKRLDDLARSIKDGRFHEQKYRLKNCGLQNVIYLIEQMKGDYFGLPLPTLSSAIAKTQVLDKFRVQMKRNHRESMLYLSQVTTILTKMFQGKTLFCCKKEDLSPIVDVEDDIISLCTFKNFNHNMGKSRNMTIRETLQKQLMQLHGVSSEISWAVVKLYPTPKVLREAFLQSGETLLQDIQYGPLKRRIGTNISKNLHSFYTLQQFVT